MNGGDATTWNRRSELAEATAFLVGQNNERIELPQPLYRALRDAIKILSRGDAIVIGSLHQKLTTTQAADLLGVSRQYLTRLIDRGELPHTMVGRHRRLRLGDVLTYRDHRAQVRRNALAQIHQLDVELGAYDALPVCAAILDLREHDLFAVRWSKDILVEMRRGLVEYRGMPADKIDHRIACMQDAFPDAEVTGYEALIPGISLPDADDRHVLAAAITGKAELGLKPSLQTHFY